MENSNGVAVLRIAFDGDDEREAERSAGPRPALRRLEPEDWDLFFVTP